MDSLVDGWVYGVGEVGIGWFEGRCVDVEIGRWVHG